MISVAIKEKTFVQKERTIEAISELSFQVKEGECVAIVGPTGCGKTTLLRMIAGFENSFKGEIRIHETPVLGTSPLITMMFQQQSLFPWLTLEQNIAFSLVEKKRPKAEIHNRVAELIDLVGLKGFAKAHPHTLSGGMQQRGVLARALAFDVPILLLDEPFGALDDRTRRELQAKLVTINKDRGKTSIIVTHSIDEALYLADRVLIMSYRPSTIIKEIRVPLSHPRDRSDTIFSQLHLEIRETLNSLF